MVNVENSNQISKRTISNPFLKNIRPERKRNEALKQQ